MPFLCHHMGIALDALSHLDSFILDPGSYLLGATLPDIHIIMPGRLTREQTHFFELGKEPEVSALIERLEQEYPGGGALGAGYLSHLIVDVIWIQEIYRPFFSPASPIGNDPLAPLMDRTLQYELDLRERRRRERIAQLERLLSNLKIKEDCFNLGRENLMQWCDFILASLPREPSWQRFPSFVRNFLLATGKVRPEPVEEFLASLPEMIDRVLEYVTEDRLVSFREKAVALSVSAARKYLKDEVMDKRAS